MRIGRGKLVLGAKSNHFVHHKSHKDHSGIELGPLQWEDGSCLRHGIAKNRYLTLERIISDKKF
jgi:hypothetical protein